MKTHPLIALSTMAAEMLKAAQDNDWATVDVLQASISARLERDSPVDLCTRFPEMKDSIVDHTQKILAINVEIEKLLKSNLRDLSGLTTVNSIEQKLNRAYSVTP